MRMCKGISTKHVGNMMPNFSPTLTMKISAANDKDKKFDMMQYYVQMSR